ncbi:MAG: hypothetical protein ACE5GO_07670 [Anaerolineales bacterium]
MRARYLAGGFGYGEVKQALYELLEARFGEAREKFDAYHADKKLIDAVLLEGAKKARYAGAKVMRKARRAVGVRHKRELLVEG